MTSMMLRMLGGRPGPAGLGRFCRQIERFRHPHGVFDRNCAVRLKQVVAEQFVDLETLVNGINGPDGSTILTERNKVAWQNWKSSSPAGSGTWPSSTASAICPTWPST